MEIRSIVAVDRSYADSRSAHLFAAILVQQSLQSLQKKSLINYLFFEMFFWKTFSHLFF
jgi:hypothetical protein